VSGIDPTSTTWVAVEEYGNKRISTAREYLESSTMAHEETQFTRGYIKALKELLELPMEGSSTMRDAESIKYD